MAASSYSMSAMVIHQRAKREGSHRALEVLSIESWPQCASTIERESESET
jgi:hypothetical protein